MSTQTIVSPENIFNTLWGFQRTAALKTGIDLDIFTAIAEGDRTAAALAKKSGASERGPITSGALRVAENERICSSR